MGGQGGCQKILSCISSVNPGKADGGIINLSVRLLNLTAFAIIIKYAIYCCWGLADIQYILMI
jgi:hypothetical protein